MAAIEVPESRARTRRVLWVSVYASLVSAVLFLGSALLQLLASLQRWVVFSASRTSHETSAEDHRFDYTFPWDHWEPIGTAAEQYGAGTLIMALGVLAMPLGLSALPRAAADSGGIALLAVSETLLAVLVAGALAIAGTHAVLSGLDSTPSPLQRSWAVGWVAVVGLIILAVLWRRTSRAATAACVFLIGNTVLGHLIATYVIAPPITGGSHDTAAWSETVVAASAAAAGITMIVVAVTTARRMPRPAAWDA